LLPDGGSGDEGGLVDGGTGPTPGLTGCRAKPFANAVEVPRPSGITVNSFRIAGSNAYAATPPPEAKIRRYLVNALGEPQGEAVVILPGAPSIQNHAFASDGETLLFFQGRDDDDAGAVTRIWRSSRPSGQGAWPAPVQMTTVAPSADLLEPYIAGSSLYFGIVVGTKQEKLARVTRAGTIFSSTITELDEINGDPGDANGFPVVSEDELEIFFMSKRTGSGDIYRATRATKQEKFSAPALITGLPTGNEERPTFLTADSCTLFVTIKNAGGTFSLYRAAR
jgi:hypothetical protein